MSALRFYVVTLRGFPSIGTDVQTTDAYVLDRAHAHRVVTGYAERLTRDTGGRLTHKAARAADVIARAREHADTLNARAA